MARIKGSMLVNRMKYLAEQGNEEQKKAVVAKLSLEFQQDVKRGLLPVAWYPIDYMTELVRAIDQVLGKGDMGLYADIGYHSGAQAAHGLYKLFFKLGTPEFIISKAPALWKQLMDSGECYFETVEKKTIRIGFRGFDVQPSLEVFLGLTGWTRALLEKSGAKNVSVKILNEPSEDNFGGELFVKWE